MAYTPKDVINAIRSSTDIVHVNFYYEKHLAVDKIILIVITKERDKKIRTTQVQSTNAMLHGLIDLASAVFTTVNPEKLVQFDDVDMRDIVLLSASFSIDDNTNNNTQTTTVRTATIHAGLWYKKNRSIIKREVDDVISQSLCILKVLPLFQLYTRLLNYEQSYQTYKDNLIRAVQPALV